jgi:hypothetical protein
MEEVTSFSTEKDLLLCLVTMQKAGMIWIRSAEKKSSHDATESGDVSRTRRAVANVLYASSPTDEMYLSGPF